MATRCNVVLTDSVAGSKVFLYRHWDGYLAEAGGDIAEKLKASLAKTAYSRGFREMLTTMVCEKRGGEGRDKDRPQYEVTDDVHGDIEHLYEVSFNAGRMNQHTEATITHSTRRPGQEFGAKVAYTLAGFISLVNADRVETNKRLASLRASSKHYADCQDYPMIEGGE